MNARELLEQLRVELKHSIDVIIEEAIQRAESDTTQNGTNPIEIVQDENEKHNYVIQKAKETAFSLSSLTLSDDEKELYYASMHNK